jgi:hypothetical protein
MPTAKQAMEILALAEAENASEALRQKKKADAEKKALIDKLSKPSGISEQEALKRAAEIVQRAVKNGLTEVEVFRFPNALCTDNGRAINNGMEPGWGEHPDRAAEGDVFLLGSAPAPDRIQDPRSGRRLLWRRAGRHRSHAEMGLNESAIEQSCSAALKGTSPRRQNEGRRGTA